MTNIYNVFRYYTVYIFSKVIFVGSPLTCIASIAKYSNLYSKLARFLMPTWFPIVEQVLYLIYKVFGYCQGMHALTTHLGLSWHLVHCYGSQKSYLDRTVSCFPSLESYVLLSDTMKANSQWEGFYFSSISGDSISCIWSEWYPILSNRDLLFTFWERRVGRNQLKWQPLIMFCGYLENLT